jgi:hypothetical protein
MEPPQISNMFPTADGKLALQWGIPEQGYHGIVIAVSLHPEFPESSRRMFVLPPVNECTLDVGKGAWFVRIGGCEGSLEAGKVNWSGVYGPVDILSTKTPPTLEECPVKAIHSQQIQNGFRIHLSDSSRRGFLIERCSEKEGAGKFPVGTTSWSYFFDKGLGWLDCRGLIHPNLYSLRISAFDMAPVENPAFPWLHTFPTKQISEVTRGIAFHKKTSARARFQSIKQTVAVDSLLTEQRKANPNMKFASHSDYLRYVVAQERMGDTKQAL